MQDKVDTIRYKKILLITTAYNGLCQRIHDELNLYGHKTGVELTLGESLIVDAVQLFQPDLIICPFLKQRIPESIWKNYTCIIVHPGIIGDRGPSSLDWAIQNNPGHWGVTALQAAEGMDAGDIWFTGNFPLRTASKASVYRREVTDAATQGIHDILVNFNNDCFKP